MVHFANVLPVTKGNSACLLSNTLFDVPTAVKIVLSIPALSATTSHAHTYAYINTNKTIINSLSYEPQIYIVST